MPAHLQDLQEKPFTKSAQGWLELQILCTLMVLMCFKLNVHSAFRPAQKISNKCKSYSLQN